MIAFIQNCFCQGVILVGLNAMLIALVPKCSNLAIMTNLRPISLYNTLHKVITNIIMSRLKPHL